MKVAVRPAAISSLLIFLRLTPDYSNRNVRSSFQRSCQRITFEFCSLIGQRFAKKSSASTRKATNEISNLEKRLDSERVLPKERFARLVVDRSGWGNLFEVFEYV